MPAAEAEPWGEIEMEPEVESWLNGLLPEDFGHAAFSIDLLASRGVLLGEPHTRQLDAKLRELRFHMGSALYRITLRRMSLYTYRSIAGRKNGLRGLLYRLARFKRGVKPKRVSDSMWRGVLHYAREL